MALSFGVTVLPDPPYQRLVELIKLAEEHGFEYGWTYDSHVLWQESTPTLALAAAATERIKLGHMVTNPGTREPTVVASAYATLHDISDGRMVMGIGRGDSARRYINQKPVRVEALRGSAPDDQAVHERREGASGTTPRSSSTGCGPSCRRSRCTWRATGRRCWRSRAASATA